MAALLLHHAVHQAHEAIEVCSAGTHATTGDTAAALALEVMKGYGIDLSEHRSSEITSDRVEWADPILTMTAEQKTWVNDRFPDVSAKVFTLSDYVGQAGDIVDPFGGKSAVEACARELADYISKMLRMWEASSRR
jgi:protein arginine phosphatase